MKALLIVYSYHHRNTWKIAEVIAEELGARLVTPQKLRPDEVGEYELVGFGSGIDSGKHYPQLLTLIDTLPEGKKNKAFIVSTSAIISQEKMRKDHAALREKLLQKGYLIVGEFSCKGYNTNSFLKYFGGMNKGRPNENDIQKAREFAQALKQGPAPEK